MKYLTTFTVLTSLPFALSGSPNPPDKIVEFCKQKGQVAHNVNGMWKCVQVSDICDEGQDQETFHFDRDMGKWMCCPEGYVVQDDQCVDSTPPPSVCTPSVCTPSVCSAAIRSAEVDKFLRDVLGDCFPHDKANLDAFIQHHINSLEDGINLIETIYKNENNGHAKQHSTSGHNGNSEHHSSNGHARRHSGSGPKHEWWKCPRDNSPCKWLHLENNNIPKPLRSTYDKKILPHPNVQQPNYRYPFDTWVTRLPGDDLSIYIHGQEVRPQGAVNYLIPAGTAANDVYYKSITGTEIQFYGVCSADTPCVRDEILPWTQGMSHWLFGQDGEIDVRNYDYDLVLTLADTEVTSEQYTVLVDGKEIGKTHGRLTLGADKYNQKHIKNVDVGSGAAGALRSITNDGFWGSFRIPREAKKVSVNLGQETNGWPIDDFVFEYRLDRLCSC